MASTGTILKPVGSAVALVGIRVSRPRPRPERRVDIAISPSSHGVFGTPGPDGDRRLPPGSWDRRPRSARHRRGPRKDAPTGGSHCDRWPPQNALEPAVPRPWRVWSDRRTW